MKTLALFSVEAIDHLVQPEEFSTSLNSPALDFVIDFKQHQPTTLDAYTNAIEAQEIMQREQSRLKLVIDDNKEMLGLISQDALSSQAIIRKVASGDNRHELTVADLMFPREQLKALAYQQLENCTIADVVNTLQSSGEQYSLIIDRESHHIRGVISAQDIARRLHMPLTINKTPTFLSIFDSLSN